MPYPPNCKHWQDIGIRNGGNCAIGSYNRPSFGVCAHCKKAELVAIGLPPPNPVPEKSGPGDLVKAILSAMGVHAKPNCGCEAMRRQMNDWGITGCVMHYSEIINWFKAKADAEGIRFDAALVWRIVTTGKIVGE